MSSKLMSSFKSIWSINKHERMKLLFLSISFFLIIAAYTIMKELKDSVFVYTVGTTYLPWAKIAAMFVLIPAILLFSFLVDRMRRYHLLCLYTVLFGIVGIGCSYLLGNPVIGLDNTHTSPYRIFGWLFYFFVEGYSPFIVSLFWSFANSVSNPKEAKQCYPIMVASSKLGGLFAAIFSWYFFSCHYNVLTPLLSGTGRHQIVVLVSSVLLLCVPGAILLLMRVVPGYYMHGYEAVYKKEKENKREGKDKTGIFAGLTLLVRLPYVMGIFGFIFFYEVVNTILAYQRLIIAESSTTDVAGLSCSLFQQICFVHLFGFFISLFGTSWLLRRFGERISLLLVPILIGILVAIFMLFGSWHWNVLTTVFVLMRAIHYALSYPVRESLYVPTMKEVKFKSKSWIDSFGQRFAKGFGSVFNKVAEFVFKTFGTTIFITFEGIFFGVIIGFWVLVAYLLGRRYERVVKHNEIIGLPEEN